MLILIVFFITQLLVIAIKIALSFDIYLWLVVASVAHNGNTVAYAIFASSIVCCSLIGGVIKLKKRTTIKDYLCLHGISIKTAVLWFAITLVFMVIWNFIFYSLGRATTAQRMSEVYATAHPVWVLWVAFIIAGPLFEETFFRGFMFKEIQSSFLRSTGAIIITASVWAISHVQYDPLTIIFIWCLGILLATARKMTGSLLIPLGIHTFYNLCVTLAVAAALPYSR
jgi:hypothetical protein